MGFGIPHAFSYGGSAVTPDAIPTVDRVVVRLTTLSGCEVTTTEIGIGCGTARDSTLFLTHAVSVRNVGVRNVTHYKKAVLVSIS